MKPSFWHEIGSYEEWQEFISTHKAELGAQRAYEQALFGGRSEFTVSGYCSGCDCVRPLKVDLNWGDGRYPNWRERLECTCGLNNRIRASLQILADLIPDPSCARVYATEQVTALFAQLRKRYPLAVGSEFIRDGTTRGHLNAAGIRHEDVTALTFPTGSMDAVLSFDVLEHVPGYIVALREMARVLRPGGTLLASFPFDTGKTHTEIRASVGSDGTINHHLPPEYHGDPVDNSGCLCFQVFGWSVFDDLRAAGFVDARTVLYWSPDCGYLGPNQMQIVATTSHRPVPA
jgi:SAM-dependent methyltransferase